MTYPWCKKLLGMAPALLLGALLMVPLGCGGSRPVYQSAKKHIKGMKNEMDNAENWVSSENYVAAISCYDEAERHLKDGRKIARIRREKRELKSLGEKLSSRRAEIEILKKKKDAEVAKKREEREEAERLKAEAKKAGKKETKVAAEDPAALMRKLKEKKKKEEAKKAVDDLKALDIKEEKPKATEEKEEEQEEKVVGADGKVDPKKAKAPAQTGPYRNYGANPPDLSIDRVSRKGNFAICWFQAFNMKSDVNKRIGRAEVVFRDDGNGKLMDTRFVFEYKKFKMDVKDLTDQPDGSSALTAASHWVPGNGSIKLVAIAEDARYAKRAKKAAVTLHFEDGTSVSDSGPNSISSQEKKPALPGL